MSGFPYADFLNAVIDDGIEEVRLAYGKPEVSAKRDGAFKGFEECRGKDMAALLDHLHVARRETEAKRRAQASDYWFWRYRDLQVEFVLNVVNAAAQANGMVSNFTPTLRGLKKAADILGVHGDGTRSSGNQIVY